MLHTEGTKMGIERDFSTEMTQDRALNVISFKVLEEMPVNPE